MTILLLFPVLSNILMQAMEEVAPLKGRVDLIMSQGVLDLLFLILTTDQETPQYLVRQSTFSFHPPVCLSTCLLNP